jgi:predicted GH43/DUF377 family glycosyl hydrolase
MSKTKFLLTRFSNGTYPKPLMIPRKEVSWEGMAIFNPTIIRENEKYIMLYRSYPNSLKELEPRVYRPGNKLGNDVSYIGLAESDNGINFIKKEKPFISPSESYDLFGCEDPRVSKLDNYFYITYTAIDAPLWENKKAVNIRIAMARTRDFKSIEKLGIVGPSITSKAACIWPERIDGKVGFVYTESADSSNSSIKIKYFDDVKQILETKDWSESFTILKTEKWLHRGPELGAVPLKTKDGWRLIFSSESMTDSWSVSAALLDLNKPQQMINRTKGFILEPATEYERNGLVPNVTFPSGAIIVNDEIWVYYGAADTVIGLAKGKYKDLIKIMKKY